MIRAIIERQVKNKESLPHMLQQLRSSAMQWPGYISGETLMSTSDPGKIITISTWRSLEDWEIWEKSEKRAALYQQIEPLLAGKPVVSTYEILATEATPR